MVKILNTLTMFLIFPMLAPTGFGFLVLCLLWLREREPLKEFVQPSHFHDLGNLMLTFVILWAYMAFSQYLIIWSGNLPEEIPWYLRRLQGGWGWVGVALVLFHFVLPFLLLLLPGRAPAAEARSGASVTLIGADPQVAPLPADGRGAMESPTRTADQAEALFARACKAHPQAVAAQAVDLQRRRGHHQLDLLAEDAALLVHFLNGPFRTFNL